MYRLRNYILCAFISIILFFSAAASEAIIFVKNYAMAPQVYHSVLEKRSVYEKAYNEIKKYYENEENATGIPAEVYLRAVTPEVAEQIINDNIDSAFEALRNGSGKIDYSSAEKRLDVLKDSVDKFFDEYASSINYKKDEAYYQKTESVFREASVNILEITDVFQFRKIEKAGYISKATKAVSYESLLSVISLAAAGLCVFILIIANIRKLADSFYWISISLGSLSVVMLVVCIWLKTSDFFSRFAIKASQVFSAITGVCVYFTDVLIVMNIVIAVVSVVMMILFSVFGKEKPDTLN